MPHRCCLPPRYSWNTSANMPNTALLSIFGLCIINPMCYHPSAPTIPLASLNADVPETSRRRSSLCYLSGMDRQSVGHCVPSVMPQLDKTFQHVIFRGVRLDFPYLYTFPDVV